MGHAAAVRAAARFRFDVGSRADVPFVPSALVLRVARAVCVVRFATCEISGGEARGTSGMEQAGGVELRQIGSFPGFFATNFTKTPYFPGFWIDFSNRKL